MKIITERLDLSPDNLPFLNQLYSLEDFFLFDIETTGLNHTHSRVILIGYIHWVGDHFQLKQLFCKGVEEEALLLQHFLQDVIGKTCLVTFNGQSFDIPFMNSRYRLLDIPFQLDKRFSLDVLRCVRKAQEQLQFENYKLKTVEKYLGIERQDQISGKESVEMYLEYARTGNPQLEKTILLHNYEDILYLVPCMDILNHIGWDIIWKEAPLSVPIFGHLGYLHDVKVQGHQIMVQVFIPQLFQRDQQHFEAPVPWSYGVSSNLFSLTLPCFQLDLGSEKSLFLDIDHVSQGDIQFNDLPTADKQALQMGSKKDLNMYNLHQFLMDYCTHAFSQRD